MAEIMSVYISNANKPEIEAGAALELPAMPYALLDALDKAHVRLGDELYFEVEEYHAFEMLEPLLTDTANLYELNALCQKLSELDGRQSTTFEGLLKMEVAKKDGSINIGKIIDLACSTDCCNVIGGANNDAELGRFYAENGFFPAAESLPDELFEMLDFEKVGRTLRTSEGGVFVGDGYVVQTTEQVEAYKSMSFTTQTPNYQILLELSDGTRLELPCNSPPDTTYHRCLDCRAPSLMAAVNDSDIQTVNTFAKILKTMGDGPMRKLKAVLSATGCNSLQETISLVENLDDYKFEESISGAREFALKKLSSALDSKEVDILVKYTDLMSIK